MIPLAVAEFQNAGLFGGQLLMILMLVFAGELLLALELFVLPGFGLGGVLGFLCLFSAVVLSWLAYGPAVGVLVILGCTVLSVVMMLVGMRSDLVKRRLVLSETLSTGTGRHRESLEACVGKKGVALTDLRPAGVVEIDEQRVDAVSTGGFIPAQSKVIVIRLDGTTAMVEVLEE